MTDHFSMELPPAPISIGTARLFSATVARFFRCEEEAVEDLKLAVSEACTVAIRTNEERGRPVRLAIEGGPNELTFSVRDGGSTVPTDGADGALEVPGGELIRALFPHAEVVSNAEGGADVRFSVPTAH
jgi:anti-sigma regulatory factor (Ser/Thr protein kinase)